MYYSAWMRVWHGALGVLLVCAVLLFRTLAAEARLTRLSQRVAASAGAVAVAGDASERLRSLSEDAARLREELAVLQQRAGYKVDADELDERLSEDHILDVVEQDGRRVIQRHLEFHSARWVKDRTQALADFSERFGLTPELHAKLEAWLVAEADAVVELLASGPRSDPAQLSADMAALLLGTDRRVIPLLEPPARAAWQQARYMERRLLWPWLPEPLAM